MPEALTVEGRLADVFEQENDIHTKNYVLSKNDRNKVIQSLRETHKKRMFYVEALKELDGAVARSEKFLPRDRTLHLVDGLVRALRIICKGHIG